MYRAVFSIKALLGQEMTAPHSFKTNQHIFNQISCLGPGLDRSYSSQVNNSALLNVGGLLLAQFSILISCKQLKHYPNPNIIK
jgi:hypothetical protein